LVIKSYNN